MTRLENCHWLCLPVSFEQLLHYGNTGRTNLECQSAHCAGQFYRKVTLLLYPHPSVDAIARACHFRMRTFVDDVEEGR
jgi:hypothetical protein